MRILTKREQQIAELLAWGASKKEVANKLYISVRTVENTARNIYEKTKVQCVAQLSAWWFITKYEIKNAVNPLLAIFFLSLVLINELYDDDDAMLRASSAKVKTVKAGRGRRRNEYEDDFFQLTT